MTSAGQPCQRCGGSVFTQRYLDDVENENIEQATCLQCGDTPSTEVLSKLRYRPRVVLPRRPGPRPRALGRTA